MQNEKKLAIIGGGPGGLTLARILALAGREAPHVTLFELDRHVQARPQGGSLDLHGESGLRALREAGLEPQFRALARYDDQYDAIYDHLGKLHFENSTAEAGDRPEIDRSQLRELLLESLDPHVIRWDSKVSSVQPLDSGRVRVLGKDAPLGEFDLVVGADGAWSKVRPLLSPEQPRYTGVTFVELSIDDVDAKHPAVAQLVPRGKVSVVGGNQALIAQRSSNGHVRAYFIFRAPEDWIGQGALDLSSPERARAGLKALLSAWDPRFFAVIDASRDHIVSRPIVELPVGHRWQHRSGLTLLGDAAHVMSPFSGEGVNMAMLDATELALALRADSDWDRAITRYEAQMFERAAIAAAGAHEGLDFVSENSLQHILEHFRELTAEPS